ncbi:MAG: GNAT family N-acetyltransferase [Rhodospirillales bacterium]|nr:GNAT family N-acetyltransferase [Rhodospirillales bacterium]MBO6788273.1 GNAT family N-acetyltransferase [Rhodospirillales bacterium]
MTNFTIRPASADEFATAVDWAAAEGWNPGLDDLASFHATDPNGFVMGFLDGVPVSSISVVKYPGGFGFLGFYIVHPDHRGTGLGIQTWDAGMAYLADDTVGLDGVVAQQDNYKKSGFVLAGRNIRHSGVPAQLGADEPGLEICPVNRSDLPAITEFDTRHFPVMRQSFIEDWTLPPDGTARHSLIALSDGEIAGLCTARQCRAGYKIGPLFAENENVAAALFDAICATLPEGAEVSLDTPEDNPAAVAMAVRAGLQPVFETARMYRGADPELPLARIFGVTTFELG